MTCDCLERVKLGIPVSCTHSPKERSWMTTKPNAGSARARLDRSEGSKRYLRERKRADERRRLAKLKAADDLEQCVGCGSWIPFGTACSHCDEIDPSPICRCETCPPQGPWTCLPGEDD